MVRVVKVQIPDRYYDGMEKLEESNPKYKIISDVGVRAVLTLLQGHVRYGHINSYLKKLILPESRH